MLHVPLQRVIMLLMEVGKLPDGVGGRIKILRDKRNLTLEEVAHMIGVRKQTVFKYENEIISNIPYERIVSLATALNTTPGFLIGWGDPAEAAPAYNEAVEQYLRDEYHEVREEEEMQSADEESKKASKEKAPAETGERFNDRQKYLLDLVTGLPKERWAEALSYLEWLAAQNER